MSVRSTPPSLSVALLAEATFATIARTVSHVAVQAEALQIELLILAATPDALQIDSEVVGAFHSVRVLPVSLDRGSGVARALAVREAAAPVIVFGEDHCFPEVGWAGALLSAHQGPWAAVGPVVTNANPTTTVSWADYLMGYGPWIAPGKSEEREHLPGHNSSYKREPLLPFGQDLEALFEAETALQWRLRERGERLYQEAAARAAHTNFERWGTWLHVTYHAGRVFAATRAMPWSPLRRVAFAAASPLVPLVRLRRHLGQAVNARWPLSRILRIAPTLLIGLVVDAAGQCVGSLTGAGRSRGILVDWEFQRNVPRNGRGPATA
jgi:hypothetical protein